ncbi:MAG: metalloregulator ArsR/SmtB family transcription factor [Streptosporangiaceae bacterium]
MGVADQDVTRLRALAHPVRLGMMRQLAERPETCACDFTDVFSVSQPTISQHLKVLREAGHRRDPRPLGRHWPSRRPTRSRSRTGRSSKG